MRKPYFVSVVVGIALLVVVVGFFFMQQTIGFMSQITQATTSIFSSSQATSTTSIATSTASTTALVGSGTTKVITKVLGTVVHSGTGTLPKIQKFEPAAATVGSTIVITGTGFDRTTNYITFGTSQGRHHPDGTADNVIATEASADGKTLTFVVPSSGPSGLLCDLTNHCVGISSVRIVPGTYPVTVQDKNGTSPIDTFTVIGQ